MAIATNGVAVGNLGVTGGVSTTGALTVAVGGSLLTATAMMFVAVMLASATSTIRTVSSITDSVGNTWQRYTGQSANSGWNTSNLLTASQTGASIEIWYTINATINTSIDVTVNASGVCDAIACAFSPKISGYSAVQPFDQNASLPALQYVHSANTAPSISGISTNTANFIAFGVIGNLGTSNSTGAIFFNGVARDDNSRTQRNGAVEFAVAEIQNSPVKSSAYSSVTVARTTSIDNFWFIVFAVTADSQVNLAARPYAALIG